MASGSPCKLFFGPRALPSTVCAMIASIPGSPERRRLRPARPTSSGFTLIEILVVIVVLGVLATLVAPNVFRHVGSAKESAARSQIEMLGAALDAYRLDNSRYPTTEQGLAALWDDPGGDPHSKRWRGPYLKKAVPVDPWGNAYVYRSPGEHSRLGYDLLSRGADGRPGGEGEDADVTSWN